MKFLTLSVAAALCLAGTTTAKVFDECELASELWYVHGFQDCTTIDDWVCLAYFESAWNTAAYNDGNSNGSNDYGLFQINDNYWCYSPDFNGASNDCNMDCTQLLDDDITDDCNCAEIIYNRHDFEAWYGWLNNCDTGSQTIPTGFAEGCGLPCDF